MILQNTFTRTIKKSKGKINAKFRIVVISERWIHRLGEHSGGASQEKAVFRALNWVVVMFFTLCPYQQKCSYSYSIFNKSNKKIKRKIAKTCGYMVRKSFSPANLTI